MFTVTELALEAAAPLHIVRCYARVGLLKLSTHQENGYRLFGSKDIQRLRFIRLAKAPGFYPYHVRASTAVAHHSDCHHIPDTGHRVCASWRVRRTPDATRIQRTYLDYMRQTPAWLKFVSTNSSNLEGDQNEHYR